MKLTERLPEGVTADGRFYRLDFDFRNVLRMLETLADDRLMPEAREYIALRCLTKHPRNVRSVLTEVKKLLFDLSEPSGGERITSFEQDAGLIRTAFRQEYGIDLFRDGLHWVEFAELLRNLPDGNRYEEILGVRTRPIPPANKYNAKERENLIRAKQHYAIRLTEQEAAKKYDRDVGNVFAGLMSMIPKEGKPDE